MGRPAPAAREHSLTASDGTRLFVRDWMVERPQGALVILHGLGEHCGRYLHVARFLNEQGWSVRTYDHRGHGQSGGARGDAPDNEALVRDAEMMVANFARETGQRPVLFGHSMGGLFAARVATGGKVPLRALSLSSPALAVPLNAFQKLLLRFMSAVAPGVAVKNNVKSRYVSHDEKVVKAYDSDPLVHDRITARLLNGMLAAIDFAHANAASLSIPVQLQVAGDDHLVDAAGARAFHARLPAHLRTMHWYDQLYHEIFNELDARAVFEDLGQWLAALRDSSVVRQASAA
jgi:alpha-beta hydrolase superfamily lysophospholipase